MKQNNSLVSIVMPAYNAERFLAKAIESILSQSFKNFEFLIMDDGSTDSTWQILQEYAEKDKRIKLFQQENKGVAISLNYLISQARGEFIARMDADDISHSERLEKQLAYFSEHPDVGLVDTARTAIAPNDLAFCTFCFPNSHDLIKNHLSMHKNPITHPAVMIKKSVLLRLNEPPYKVIREKTFEDEDLWNRLINLTTFAIIQKPLYYVRYYSGSVTNRWFLKKDSIIAQHYKNEKKDILSENLDNIIAALLKVNLNPQDGYDCFLNAKALFINHCYLEALKEIILSVFKNKNYRLKSLGLIPFILFGGLGIYLFSKLRFNEYEQLPIIEN